MPFEARLYEPILLDDAPEEEIEIDEEGAEVEKPVQGLHEPAEPRQPHRAAPQVAVRSGSSRTHAEGARFQFLRMGYFAKDPDSTPEKPVYNRVVPLKDSWQKVKNG